jgi:DNA-binding response OmpR family regulator
VARWILVVGGDSELAAGLEKAFQGSGFRLAAAKDEAQGLLQARELKPSAVISAEPFLDEAALDGVPFLVAGLPLDAAAVKARVLALIEGRKIPAPLPAPAPVQDAVPAPPAKAPVRWLIVGGADPALARVVEMAIMGTGLSAAAAGDAAELELQARTLKPELIICDLGAPELASFAPEISVPTIYVGGPDAKALGPERLHAMIQRRLAGEPEPPDPSPAVRGTVLLLDADPAVSGALRDVLAGLNFRADASGFAQALGQARDLKPVLVISDLEAPGAVELLTEMRLDALLSGIPFLFVGSMPADRAMAMLPWGDPTVRYTRKPLDPEKVKALVNDLTDPGSA